MSTSSRLPPPLALPCPLCTHPYFESAIMLRDRLIFVSTHNLTCPICKEEVVGLDKLTIHLFSHVKINNKKESETLNSNSDKVVTDKPQVCKRARTHAKIKPFPSAKVPVKYVKIFPKLPVISLNTMPLIEISHKPMMENINNPVRMMTVATASQIVNKLDTSQTTMVYKCDNCSLQFADENILKMHNVLIHSFSTETPETGTSYQCHVCNKTFKMKGSLMVHLRVAHYGFPSVSNKFNNISEDLVTEPATANITETVANEKPGLVERQENKQCFCEVCKKTFTTKYFLKKHKRLHTGETPYSCIQCNKTFTFQQSYHKHLLYHNDEKPHSCNYCGRSFKELSTLHNHQRIHTGEKPFSCETCGKCFRQRVSYLVHRRIHTGVMPYKCTACEKSFRYKVSQRTHKCPAQPPGTVVRQSGELLEKLKKKHSDASVSQTQETKVNDAYSSVSEASAELIRTGAKLSFEDTESENFSLISKPLCTIESSIKQNHEIQSLPDNEEFNEAIPDNQNVAVTKAVGHVENNVSGLGAIISNSNNVDKSVPSPTDILKNLCLTSYDEDFGANGLPKSSGLNHEDINFDIMYREFHNFL